MEVQLDKETMRWLKIGERQYSKGQFRTAKARKTSTRFRQIDL
ncbi:MAG TPA: hypothetical protein VFF30_10675 [Nitrososphaerales archaeon]|nr:hypothetical protein [Nitrososphaerales archaeon]